MNDTEKGANVILVEGPDGAGKSTLVKHLCEELDLDVGKRGVQDRDELWKSTRADTYTALSMAVKGHESPLVWDRLFFSELVYHQIMDRRCAFSANEQAFVGRILDSLFCPVIFCLPPFEVVKENVTREKQMSGVVENIEYIYLTYVKWAKQWVQPYRPYAFMYDYMDPAAAKLDVLTERCRDYINEREAREW